MPGDSCVVGTAARRRRGCPLTAVIVSVALLLGPAAAPAPAQIDATRNTFDAPALDMKSTVVTKAADEPAATVEPEDIPEAAPGTGDVAPPAQQSEGIRSGDYSAQLQPAAAKRAEVVACQQRAQQLEISTMLGLPGSIGGGDGANWGPLLLAIALVSGAVALFIWRRRSRGESQEPRDPLETVSTVVALLSTVVGLALTFAPGLGIDEPPAPEAQMTVRQAQARVTHGEYVHKVRSGERLGKEDKLEVGNVIWLELRLEGYRDKPLRLQYGGYRTAESGGALLPGTTREISLGSERDDVETTFAPIWIGLPRKQADLERFRAQFRLIDPRGRIQQMAITGPMGASEFRYVC
jgi:hypothetical protein